MFASGAVGTKYMNMALAIPHSVSPYTTVYNVQIPFVGTNTRFTKLNNPSVAFSAGANYCTGAHWSPTGDILAVCRTDSPFLRFYERNGDTLTALPALNSNPPAYALRGGGWHPDGNLFVTGGDNTYPRMHISKRSATTSTRFETLSTASIFNPPSMPPSQVWGWGWNPQGNILFGFINTSPYVWAYWYDGTTFTKLANPDVLPTGATDPSHTWSPDGSIVITTHANSPWITAYWVNYNGTATTFTKLANPASLPGSTPQSIGMNNTGSSISHSLYNSPYQHAYNISYNGTSTTLTRVGSFPTMSNGGGYTTAWLPDDNSFVLGAYNAPRFQYVTRSGDTFTLQLSVVPNVLIPGATNGPGSIWPKRGNPTR